MCPIQCNPRCVLDIVMYSCNESSQRMADNFRICHMESAVMYSFAAFYNLIWCGRQPKCKRLGTLRAHATILVQAQRMSLQAHMSMGTRMHHMPTMQTHACNYIYIMCANACVHVHYASMTCFARSAVTTPTAKVARRIHRPDNLSDARVENCQEVLPFQQNISLKPHASVYIPGNPPPIQPLPLTMACDWEA